MTMRATGPANQQPPVSGAPPNQVAQGGQAQAQGPILRLSNPGANPQLRSLLLSQQQPVRAQQMSEGITHASHWLLSDCKCSSCRGWRGSSVSVSPQQGGVSHMSGMMSHQIGQQLVHPTPGGGAQMQGQWRQPLAGQHAPPTEVEVQTLHSRRCET